MEEVWIEVKGAIRMDLIHDRLAELIGSFPESLDKSCVSLKIDCKQSYNINLLAFCKTLAKKKSGIVFK